MTRANSRAGDPEKEVGSIGGSVVCGDEAARGTFRGFQAPERIETRVLAWSYLASLLDIIFLRPGRPASALAVSVLLAAADGLGEDGASKPRRTSCAIETLGG